MADKTLIQDGDAWKSFRPDGEQFLIEIDYAAIEQALQLSSDAISWSIEKGDGGQYLIGKPATS